MDPQRIVVLMSLSFFAGQNVCLVLSNADLTIVIYNTPTWSLQFTRAQFQCQHICFSGHMSYSRSDFFWLEMFTVQLYVDQYTGACVPSDSTWLQSCLQTSFLALGSYFLTGVFWKW